jgi:hypothetical protein
MLGVDIDPNQEGDDKSNGQDKPLELVGNLIKRYVKNISKYDGKDLKQSDDYGRINELIEWVIDNWKICSKFTSRKKVFDLCKSDGKMTSGSQMIALHEVLSGGEHNDAMATLLFFNKKNCKLTPCSKI